MTAGTRKDTITKSLKTQKCTLSNILATPVPKLLILGYLYVIVTVEDVMVSSNPPEETNPNVYFPPRDKPAVKYQSKPKLKPAPNVVAENSSL